MRVSLCVEFQVGGVAIKGNRFLSMALSGLRMQAPRRDLRRYRRRDALSRAPQFGQAIVKQSWPSFVSALGHSIRVPSTPT